MPITLDDLVEAIHARHLPLHISVQLTPDTLAELWSKAHVVRRRAFNALLGREMPERTNAPAPTLEELIEAAERGPAVVPCESGEWSGDICRSTYAYERTYVRLQGTARTLDADQGTTLKVCERCKEWISESDSESG